MGLMLGIFLCAARFTLCSQDWVTAIFPSPPPSPIPSVQVGFGQWKCAPAKRRRAEPPCQVSMSLRDSSTEDLISCLESSLWNLTSCPLLLYPKESNDSLLVLVLGPDTILAVLTHLPTLCKESPSSYLVWECHLLPAKPLISYTLTFSPRCPALDAGTSPSLQMVKQRLTGHSFLHSLSVNHVRSTAKIHFGIVHFSFFSTASPVIQAPLLSYLGYYNNLLTGLPALFIF